MKNLVKNYFDDEIENDYGETYATHVKIKKTKYHWK